jgi:ribonucleotide reductase beta subunit family protein with ferritin-like domain
MDPFDREEDILKEDPLRFVLFPIKYPQVFEMYQKAMASFWTPHEISLCDDVIQWLSLDADTKHFVKYILAFFAGIDGIINENLAQRFYGEVQVPEIRCFYGFQIAIENIHNETYSQIIDTYITDAAERTRLLEATETIPCIRKMAQWALKWINSDRPFRERIVAFACVEGILFCAPFCAIYWLKKNNKLSGLAMANELISRDETLHFRFACLLHSMLKTKCDKEVALQIVKEIVELEIEFITEALPCRLIGMNHEKMTEYVKMVADGLLRGLGFNPYYGATNPFDFMDLISMDNKTNFFERRVSEYSMANVKVGKVSGGKEKIELVMDF